MSVLRRLLSTRRSIICIVVLGLIFIVGEYIIITRGDSFEWRQFTPSSTSGYIGSQNSKLEPLDQYRAQPVDDNESCNKLYGPQYLQHIADNHIFYCEDGSRSSLECFTTTNSDVACVGRGVSYQKSPPKDKMSWSMNCQLRNLTTEIALDPSKAANLKLFRNVDKFKEYFYETGVGTQLRRWNISREANDNGKSCNTKKNDKKYTMFVRREGNNNIWHKLLEMWQTKLTLDALQMTDYGSSLGQPYLTAATRKDVQVVFEDDAEGPVDSLWSIVTGSEPVRLSTLSDTCLGDVILPLVGTTSPFWIGVWDDMDCKSAYLIDPFIRDIYTHLGMTYKERTTENTVVTIINRTTTRQIFNIDSHIAKLKITFRDTKFQIVDFSTISLREQFEIISQTDVLIGAMGAGLTHIFFLPKQSTVVEIMAPGAHYTGFRNLAKMRKLPYFTAHGTPEDEWKVAHGAQNDALESESEIERRHWQNDKYLYLTEEQFVALAGAAINAQLNRGTRSADVKPY
jgi:protein O-GlcNAc transferase